MLLYREISRILSFYIYFLAGVLLIPLGLAIYFQELALPELHPQPHSVSAFATTIVICLFVAFALQMCGASARGRYYKREALALVVVIWFFSAFIGGLPFYFSGTFDSMIDCYFEAMSGLTTTGATVIQAKALDPLTGQELAIERSFSDLYDVAYRFYGTVDSVIDPETEMVLYTGVEAIGKALLFWRSFMQWLGGMGIVVLFVAVLPALGVGGKALYQAEVPGPVKDTLTPRIKETASLLWKIYLGFTILEISLLTFTNKEMPLFDAVCTTFSTVSTGGFSVRNQSIASYANHATQWVVIGCMLLGSINFSLYFQVLKGKLYRFWEPEFIVYMSIIAVSCGLCIWNLIGTPQHFLDGTTAKSYSWGDAIRDGCFQSISAQTSTGFSTANYDLWPFINQVQMLIVMYIGSMAGSTGGGIKIIRHIMVFRIVQNRIESLFRPNAITTVRVGTREVTTGAAITVLSFLMVVISMSVLGTLLLALDGVDPETALATTTCMINNIGIAFRMGGPTESFAFLSPLAKMGSTVWMVAGRLEFFAVLVVLVPRFWRDT
ncbi:Trk system potassium uptake protein TrkH [Chlamydiales bacterium SCGC AG-110-P3]|nr:Trk system potassium uptake protein TrkH [Chlamydiales bacterium SCGC AG-110-P3]